MKFYPECYPCCLRQVVQICKLVEVPENAQIPVIKAALQALAEMDTTATPPEIAGRIYGLIKAQHKGEGPFDPYKTIKAESNKVALTVYNKLKKRVDHSKTPLAEAIAVAAAGNIIDFGVFQHQEMDILGEINNFLEKHFISEDIEPFSQKLKAAKSLLYLSDNAGEIVFDKLLIETISRLYPKLTITMAVREAPILNDVTLEDARAVGLDQVCGVMSSGSIMPGTPLKACSVEFKKAFQKADLIVSKGQGNYETLSEQKDERLFFLLIAKCDIIARHIGFLKGSLLFLQSTE